MKKGTIMKKFAAATAALLFTLGLTACNTMRGAGQDIQQGGEKIQNSADRVQNGQ